MEDSSKKMSCELEFKNKLDEEERRVNVENDPLTGGSLNDVLNSHESPFQTPSSDEPVIVVTNQGWRVELTTDIEKEMTKSCMLRKKKLKRPLSLGVKPRPLKHAKMSITSKKPPPTQVSNPLVVTLA